MAAPAGSTRAAPAKSARARWYDEGMHLLPVADPNRLAAWHRVEACARRADHLALPADPIDERLALLAPDQPDTGEQTLLRLGLLGGRPVGTVELTLFTKDNLSSASVNVHVLPDLRRRGLGRELLAAALDETASLGRSRVFVEAPSPYPSGAGPADGVLRTAGARPVLTEVRRLLDLTAVTAAPVPDPAAGYRLVQWQGRLPDEHLEDMARLLHRMSTDAPLGDMDWEPENWDGTRVRAKEEASLRRGRQKFGTLVVHEASGQVAGFTALGISRYLPEVAYQWETIVDRDHRGHGLGFALKAHNHRQLGQDSPVTRWVNTWNARSNTFMVDINERLGFRPVDCWTEWQLDL